MAVLQYTEFSLSGAPTGSGVTVTGGAVYTAVVDNAGGTAEAELLGGKANEFTYGGTSYTYEGTATVNGTAGFVGESGGKYYFFVESTKSPTVASGDPLANYTAHGSGSGNNNGEFHIRTGDSYCFAGGVNLMTPHGEAPVEALKAGDLVMTADGSFKPVRWIGCSVTSQFGADPAAVLPVRIKAGALGDCTPSRDLLVSPGHALFVGGVLVQAGALINGSTIVQDETVPLVFSYYHVELGAHDLLMAENVPAESFLEAVADMEMDNWSERALLDGEASTTEMAYPRIKSARQIPESVRAMLADRARGVSVLETLAA